MVCRTCADRYAAASNPFLMISKKKTLAIGVFAQMPQFLIITKTLDRIGNRAPCARFRFVRIGCIFEIARCELGFFPVASVGRLANQPPIIERSLYPFRTVAAPMMISLCVERR